MREMKNAYKIVVSKVKRKEQLGIPRCRWEDNNNKINFKEVGTRLWIGFNWLNTESNAGS
jgi:hypothetical protein